MTACTLNVQRPAGAENVLLSVCVPLRKPGVLFPSKLQALSLAGSTHGRFRVVSPKGIIVVQPDSLVVLHLGSLGIELEELISGGNMQKHPVQ